MLVALFVVLRIHVAWQIVIVLHGKDKLPASFHWHDLSTKQLSVIPYEITHVCVMFLPLVVSGKMSYTCGWIFSLF